MNNRTATTNPWFVFPKPNPGAVLRLFCFPYAGGSAQVYRDWGKGVPRQIEICAVQLPGRGSHIKEPPFTRLAPLIEALAPALRPYVDQPFALFGHSMGGLISFELARALRRNYGVQPGHLFISGRQAPSLTEAKRRTFDLPEAEFIEEVRRLSGTPAEVLENPELMQLMLPLLRADFELCETYDHTPEPPFDCPLTAFGGIRDCATVEELKAWREYTTGEFSVRRFPGDHFFLHTSQHLTLRVLTQELLKQVGSLKAETRS